MGVMGFDFFVMSMNFVGLGWYWGFEFVIFLGVFNVSIIFWLLNDDNSIGIEENCVNFNLNIFGVVFVNVNINCDWWVINFVIGVNWLVNFYQDFYFEGFLFGLIVNWFQE